MNESELKAIFEQLEAQGWQPMWCDAEIPSYDRSVPCGDLAMVYEDAPGSFSLPRKMLSMYPEFTVNVTGESMADVGVATGDTLRVICDDSQQDGDIVLASIDEELTVKVYCVDEDGNPWLVPQNKGFKPISLKDKTNVRIIGRVSMIIKNSPRVAYRECMNIIRKAKREMMEREEKFAQISKARREEIENLRTFITFKNKIPDIVKAEDTQTDCFMIQESIEERLPFLED